MSDTIRFEDTLLSDMHKDAYGYRPRGIYPEVMTVEEYHAEADRLQEVILEGMEYEREAELRAAGLEVHSSIFA